MAEAKQQKSGRTGRDGARGDPERLKQHGREMRDSGDALRQATRDAVHEAGVLARAQLREHPYTTLGIALAAGFVAGGGIPPRLLTLTAGIGMRMAVGSLLRDLHAGATEADPTDA